VSCVRRTGKEGVSAVDLAREHHSVSVVWEECVLKLMECLEVLGPCHSDGRSVVSVAPCHIVLVLDLAYSWIVAIYPLSDLRDVAIELEGLRVELPVDSVLRESYMKGHADVCVVYAEDSCIAVLERNYSGVEDAVGIRKEVARNHRIAGISPHNLAASFWTLFPWHVRHRHAYDFKIFVHIVFNYYSF
jgi:hypothetical protein